MGGLENKMISYSQASQDKWALAILLPVLKGQIGTFLDVGANHPIEISNTYALEVLGWVGCLLDNDAYCCDQCRKLRKSPVFEVDSTTFDYKKLPALDFDYMSLDVDSATLASLTKLLADGVTFRCATIEHDSYRFGPGPRDAMRAMLTAAGYKLAVADVCNPESPTMPYEDWWIDPKRT
jgi:hypothetical protein